MAICLGKSCLFGLPCVSNVKDCQFVSVLLSFSVLRLGCGVLIVLFLISFFLFCGALIFSC